MTGEYNDENIRFTTKDNTVYAYKWGGLVVKKKF